MNKQSLLSLIVGLSSLSAHALTVEPFAPNQLVSSGGLATVYYADINGAPIVVDPEYRTYDLESTSSNNNIYFYMRSMATDQQYLYIYAEGPNGENQNFPVRIAYSSSGAPITINGGVSTEHSQILFPAGTDNLQIGLNLSSICALGLDASGAKGCNSGSFDTGTSTLGMTLKFVQSASSTAPSDTAVINAGYKVKVFPENQPPVIGTAGACPAFSTWFFPGDQEFSVDTNAFTATKASSGQGASTFDMLVVAVGRPLSAAPYFGGANTIVRRIPYKSGAQSVTGDFQNSTADNQIYYQANIGARSSAGLVTFCSTPAYTQVFTTDIRSFLKESNCFVATASFRNGRAAPVMMLRQFRDQVLAKTSLGRDFISFYYAEGPRAADWLIENPSLRIPVLSLLVKVEALAWIALHPSVLWIPLAALIALVIGGLLFLGQSRATLTGALGLVLALGFSSQAQAAQPYIDSLLSEVGPSREPIRTNSNPDPYIKSQKAKLGVAEEGSYTDRAKQELGTEDSSRGYSENMKRNLGAKPGGDSAIADFKSGKKIKPNKGGDHTDHAFAFKIATAMDRSYAGDATSQDLTYPEVYGDGYVPEFTLSYEYHPIERGFFSNLGLYTSIGGTFKKANGKFAFTGPNGEYTASKTKFIFVTLPVNVGPIYRFHITNGIAPYFGGGGSVIGFVENRNDDKDSVRGYSFGYWGVAGISFGLDFLSEKSSWNQYESTSVKRTYLSLEYSYLTTIPGGLVEATVNGVHAGFTFEY